MEGNVNKHNVCIWETKSPHETRSLVRNSENVTVRCALLKNQKMVLYYFERLIITGNNHMQLRTSYFLPISNIKTSIIILQEDKASLRRYSLAERQKLYEKYQISEFKEDFPFLGQLVSHF